MNMNNMIKIGINRVTQEGIKYTSGKELKLSIGEIVSARVEKGGSGEAVIKIKGYEIDAKGAKEFKNGEILSLVVKGMENGKLLVEDLKSENIKHDIKSERTAIETAKLKESIINEIVEQKGSFTSEKMEKIVANFQNIESEIKKSLEKQVREEYKLEKEEVKIEDKVLIKDDFEKNVNIENGKIKEKKSENIKEDNSIKIDIEKNSETEIKTDMKSESSIFEKYERKESIIENEKTVLKKEDKIENTVKNNEKIEENVYELNKAKVEDKEIKKSTKFEDRKIENTVNKIVLKDNIGKEEREIKGNINKNEKIDEKQSIEIKVKNSEEKIKNNENKENNEVTRYYINSKNNIIKKSEVILSDTTKKELNEKYKISEKFLNINEENTKKPEREIAEFIIEKRADNFKTGIMKTLVKLENAETGLNPEIFKKVFEFYDKESTTIIMEEENSENGLKNYIKELSEGKDIKSESTTVVNVLNKMEDKNIIEFMVNSNLLKNAAEIKIKSESNGKNEKEIKNVNYITINLELEKIGKMTVSVVLSEKKRANLSFYVSQEKIKDNIKSDEEDLKRLFLAKGISVENINIKDLKKEEENISINCKI